MTGKFYGVGVGCGDPELITLKAVRILKECDILLIPKTTKKDSTAFSIVKEYVKESCIKVELPFSMDTNKAVREKERIETAQKVFDFLVEGKNVVFITLGDSTIYSTCFYLYKALCKKGIVCEIVPGVPSFCSVAAALGISIAEENDSFGVIPVTGGTEVLKKAAESLDTLILMKSSKNIAQTKEILNQNGFLSVLGVERCGMADEKKLISWEEIEASTLNYFTTLIAKKGSADK